MPCPSVRLSVRPSVCTSRFFCEMLSSVTIRWGDFLFMQDCSQYDVVVQDTVRLSDDPFIWSKLTFKLRQFSANTLSFVRCSPLILFVRLVFCLWNIVPNILKLCKTPSVCPTIRFLGRNWRLNLDNFSENVCIYTKFCEMLFTVTILPADFSFMGDAF